jgi:ankyrin repeat protein
MDLAVAILEHGGVDLNTRDIEGWTALHAAAATGNMQMINMLADRGASLVAINNDDKMPVDVAADGDIRYVLQQKMLEAGEYGVLVMGVAF